MESGDADVLRAHVEGIRSEHYRHAVCLHKSDILLFFVPAVINFHIIFSQMSSNSSHHAGTVNDIKCQHRTIELIMSQLCHISFVIVILYEHAQQQSAVHV